jgi:HAMP domain-containing protein
VLGAIFVLGLYLVRVGLRPLGRIEHTAAAIAGGDLSQRVENDDPRTEVGRLGGALNAMLGRSRRPSTSAPLPRTGCAGSSPTPRTSSAPRSQPCVRTRSCSTVAPASARTTSSGR